MMNEMHIVTTDLPRGLDDAQGSDAFFIIKSLYEKQIRVHLHCFDKQEENAIAPINEICSSINFYERDIAKISLKPDLPYHVSTRSSTQLIDKLNQDELPILFIGLSVSYPIYSRQLKSGRKIAVRLNKNERIMAFLKTNRKFTKFFGDEGPKNHQWPQKIHQNGNISQDLVTLDLWTKS